jgi:hypothetical protein
VHCIAHRGALAVGDAFEDNAVACGFERMLLDILGYYSHSSKRTSSLQQLQHDLGVAELKMINMHKVRWLSRAGVCQRILSSYPALVQEFNENTRGQSTLTNCVTGGGQPPRSGAAAMAIHATMVMHYFVVCLTGRCTDAHACTHIVPDALPLRIFTGMHVFLVSQGSPISWSRWHSSHASSRRAWFVSERSSASFLLQL